MSKKEKLGDKEIDFLIKDLDVAFSKSKEDIWDEVNKKLDLESKPEKIQESKNVFQINWKFSIAASILIIVGTSLFFNNQQNLKENQHSEMVDSISLENSSIVESLFMEESQVEEYLSLYVINEIIDE